jgi:exopolyphosphatase/guanosine-5'-triphosphate,3'-diphosphate pyrophosphatase
LGTYEKELESVFDSHDLSQFSSENVICVAGTMTSLARMIHQQDNNSEASIDDIEGMEIETSKLENFSDLMESRSSEDLLAEFSFLKARSQTIAAGAKAALAVLLKVGCKTVCISTKGLRHGTIICGGIDERYKI